MKTELTGENELLKCLIIATVAAATATTTTTTTINTVATTIVFLGYLREVLSCRLVSSRLYWVYLLLLVEAVPVPVAVPTRLPMGKPVNPLTSH